MQDQSARRVYFKRNAQVMQQSHSLPLDNLTCTKGFRTSTQKTDKSSMAFLSSLIQTEVVAHNQPRSVKRRVISQRSQQFNNTLLTIHVEPQKGLRRQREGQILADKFFSDRMQSIGHKQRAIVNLVGRPDSQFKKYTKTMEDTIRKARTCKIIPVGRNGRDESLVNIQNRRRMRVQFDQHLKIRQKRVQLAQQSRQIERRQRDSLFGYSKAHTIEPPTQQQGVYLYHFLKQSLSKRKKQVISKPSKTAYQLISRRIANKALIEQLGPEIPVEFTWTKLDSRSPFKLKTEAP